MGSRYVNDPGLQYLQEIGFNRIRGKYGLFDRLIKTFGRSNAERIWNERMSIPDGSKEFYEFKNSDPEISRAFSEAYDGDIIRKACNYIFAHKESFGDTILEVGCESGYMTGFLAKTFPDAKIVSIDRSSSAVEMAKNKIVSMGLTNVEFRATSLEDINEQYDTVFCMRTIQENISHKTALFAGEPIIPQFLQYSEITEQYTEQLISCLKDNGKIIIFERVAHDPLMCGWMMGLCFGKCAPDLDSYEEIKCEEFGETEIFQAFICHNKTEEDPQKMIDLWCRPLDIDVSQADSITGWPAMLYLEANAGKLCRGVRILDSDNKTVGRFAIFHDKDDEDLMYYLIAAGCNEIQLLGFREPQKELMLDHMNNAIERNVKAGLHEKEIEPDEEYLEGTESVR